MFLNYEENAHHVVTITILRNKFNSCKTIQCEIPKLKHAVKLYIPKKLNKVDSF